MIENKGVALYFEKPSARTRNSMEVAAAQIGGHPVYLQPNELGIGTRESVEDVTHTLAYAAELWGLSHDDTLALLADNFAGLFGVAP